MSVPKRAPVLLKSKLNPNGRDKQLKRRANELFDVRASRMKRKLKTNEEVLLKEKDVLNLLHSIR